VRDEKVSQEIDSQRGCAPRKRYTSATVAVVVHEELIAESLCIHDETARAIWSQPDNLANDPVPGDFDGREMPFRLKRGCPSRDQCGDGAPKKTTSINQTVHRLRRLRRFTDLCNLRNLWT
jgi:hypothetical protein